MFSQKQQECNTVDIRPALGAYHLITTQSFSTSYNPLTLIPPHPPGLLKMLTPPQEKVCDYMAHAFYSDMY